VIYYRGKTGDGKTAFVLSMAQYGNWLWNAGSLIFTRDGICTINV
jgi:DNA replicative helicase MCM subunit Mcm2 (Cdc46/Mcm family)